MSSDSENKNLAVYYLRLALAFFSLWSAGDIMVHQVQWRAFLEGFPGIGVFAGVIMVGWFFILLASGLALLTGWYTREAAAALAGIIALVWLVFSFFTPAVNTVLGSFRPLAVKNLIWLGACLVIVTQPKDGFSPERRRPQGFPNYASQAHLLFRLLLGGVLIWDGLLKAFNAHGYATVLSRAVVQIPLVPDAWGAVLVVIFLVVQLAAGLMILGGVQFRWALLAMLVIAAIHLVGVNWFATKSLLRPGGRFMMRDILTLAGCVYFWLAGPGSPIVQIQMKNDSAAKRAPVQNSRI